MNKICSIVSKTDYQNIQKVIGSDESEYHAKNNSTLWIRDVTKFVMRIHTNDGLRQDLNTQH